MSFNKRTISMEMLKTFYLADRENGIQKCIGKADALFFADKDSSLIVKSWMEGDKDQAKQMMEAYVS